MDQRANRWDFVRQITHRREEGVGVSDNVDQDSAGFTRRTGLKGAAAVVGTARLGLLTALGRFLQACGTTSNEGQDEGQDNTYQPPVITREFTPPAVVPESVGTAQYQETITHNGSIFHLYFSQALPAAQRNPDIMFNTIESSMPMMEVVVGVPEGLECFLLIKSEEEMDEGTGGFVTKSATLNNGVITECSAEPVINLNGTTGTTTPIFVHELQHLLRLYYGINVSNKNIEEGLGYYLQSIASGEFHANTSNRLLSTFFEEFPDLNNFALEQPRFPAGADNDLLNKGIAQSFITIAIVRAFTRLLHAPGRQGVLKALTDAQLATQATEPKVIWSKQDFVDAALAVNTSFGNDLAAEQVFEPANPEGFALGAGLFDGNNLTLLYLQQRTAIVEGSNTPLAILEPLNAELGIDVVRSNGEIANIKAQTTELSNPIGLNIIPVSQILAENGITDPVSLSVTLNGQQIPLSQIDPTTLQGALTVDYPKIGINEAKIVNPSINIQTSEPLAPFTASENPENTNIWSLS